MKYKIIIADENKSSRDLLKYKVDSVGNGHFDVLATYGNIEQAIGAIFIHEPDILLLDLKILNDNHFGIIEKIINQNVNKIKIIIIASENQLQSIQKSVELGIAGMLIRPVNTDDMKKIFNRLAAQLDNEVAHQKHTDHFITFRYNHSKLFVKQNDIIFIESNRNVCSVTFNDGVSRVINENITSIFNRLTLKSLVRIDKSTIINMANITYVDGSEYNKSCRLCLSNGKELTKSLSKIAIQRLYKNGMETYESSGQNVK